MTVWTIIATIVLLAAPTYLLWWVSRSLLNRTALALARAMVQMAIVGTYLFLLYAYDVLWVKLLWLVLVAVIGAAYSAGRAHLPKRTLLTPLVVSLTVTTLVITLYLLLLLLQPLHPLTSRWVVPVAGLLLAASQDITATAMAEYHKAIHAERQRYEYLLGNGASHVEAVMPFVRRAVERALSPSLRSMSTMGLATLPAFFLGLMMNGKQPLPAAILVIILTIGSISAAVLSTALALYLVDRRSFKNE